MRRPPDQVKLWLTADRLHAYVRRECRRRKLRTDPVVDGIVAALNSLPPHEVVKGLTHEEADLIISAIAAISRRGGGK